LKALTLFVAVVGAALLLPAGAHAATLTNAAGTLTYTATPGNPTAVGFWETGPAGTVQVHRFADAGDDDAIPVSRAAARRYRRTRTCVPA
jgi:hypothetical protein